MLGEGLISMRILITGGAGYLGSVITGRLLSEGHKVTVLDKLQFKQVSLLPYCFSPNFEFVYGDVRNFNLLKKLVVANDVIIPLAAVVGFPACDDDPQLAYDLNYKQKQYADGLLLVVNRVLAAETPLTNLVGLLNAIAASSGTVAEKYRLQSKGGRPHGPHRQRGL